MDPEFVPDLINSCFNHLFPIINKYGDRVDKFIGDEIMALFGALLVYENDAERAMHPALQMQEEIKIFNKTHRLSLSIHFGINTGLVIAGYIGTFSRQEYSVMGHATAALEHYRRSAKGYWEAGNLRSWASVKMAQSLLWIPENISERFHLCELVIRVSQDAGDRQAWGWGLFMLAATLGQVGELEEAIAKTVQALDLVGVFLIIR